jgi:hypothetical protein
MLLYSIAFHTRFGAILQPMKLDYWKRRGRFMLAIAWACSVICSLPQVGNVGYLIFQFHCPTLLSVAASLLLKKLWKWRLIKAHWCSSQILPFQIIKSRCHPPTFCLSQARVFAKRINLFLLCQGSFRFFLSHIPFKIVSIELEIKDLK